MNALTLWHCGVRRKEESAALIMVSPARIPSRRLPPAKRHATFTGMYVVTEADAAAIREAYETGGELSAAVELRRRFPGITDNALARQQATAIAGWTPLPARPKPPRRVRKAPSE